MNAADTNILIYRVDDSEPVKRAKARSLLRKLRAGPDPTVLLWHVGGEFLRYLRYRQHQGQLTATQVRHYFNLARRDVPLILPTATVFDRALDLADKYSLSHWDSMLLGACIEAGVDTLYTEDMGAPIVYEGVQLINPFI